MRDPTAPTAATLAHAALLAEIHAAAFPPAESWSRDVIALQLELPTTFALLHSAGGFVMARAVADEAEILTLAVIPAFRRQGLGRRLLGAAMTRAAVLGAAAMFLEVATTNHAARGLYVAMGFVESGLRRRYYADGTDALVLRSTLAPPMPTPTP